MHLQNPLQINDHPSKAATPESTIHLAHRFTAPPEQVFRAWLDPTLAGRWLFATAWRPMTEVRITPHVGGTFAFTDGHALHTGRYTCIAAPSRLEFSLTQGLQQSLVSVELAPRGTGCLLRLEQSGLAPEQARHAKGRWMGMLYGLSLLLDEEGQNPPLGFAQSAPFDKGVNPSRP